MRNLFVNAKHIRQRAFRRPYPDCLYDWLVIGYGLPFSGQIRAWWIPLFFLTGTEASSSLSNHVRQNTLLLADAQWNGPKHRAYPASFGNRLHVDRSSSHEVRTVALLRD
jgi:hypothetical protein